MKLENITINLVGESRLSAYERMVLLDAIATLPLEARASSPAVLNASLLKEKDGMPREIIYLTPAESIPLPNFEFDLKNLPEEEYSVSFCFGKGVDCPLITITEVNSPTKRMYCIFSES